MSGLPIPVQRVSRVVKVSLTRDTVDNARQPRSTSLDRVPPHCALTFALEKLTLVSPRLQQAKRRRLVVSEVPWISMSSQCLYALVWITFLCFYLQHVDSLPTRDQSPLAAADPLWSKFAAQKAYLQDW